MSAPVSERNSTWGAIICANLWIVAGPRPFGPIAGTLALLLVALLLWAEWYSNRGTAPGGA